MASKNTLEDDGQKMKRLERDLKFHKISLKGKNGKKSITF